MSYLSDLHRQAREAKRQAADELRSVGDDVLRDMDELAEQAGVTLMDGSDRVQSLLRRGLGLPEQAPDPSGLRISDSQDGGLTFPVGFASPEEIERERNAWHAEGRRGAVADGLSNGLFWTGKALAELQVSGLLRRAEDAAQRPTLEQVGQARELVFESHFQFPTSGTTEAEGWLRLPDGRMFELDITTIEAERYELRGALTHGLLRMGSRQDGTREMVLPCKVLTPALVEAGLRAWYMGHFAWERGHWTALERTLPSIKVDPDMWETVDATDERQVRAARRAEKSISKLLNSEESRRLYARYGTVPFCA